MKKQTIESLATKINGIVTSEYSFNSEETKLFNKLLGSCGRMISGSKTLYKKAHKKNVVIFNANIVDSNGVKMWYGDIDVTKDEERLLAIGEVLNKDFYLLYEMDARFDNEQRPKLHNYAFKYESFFSKGLFPGAGLYSIVRRTKDNKWVLRRSL